MKLGKTYAQQRDDQKLRVQAAKQPIKKVKFAWLPVETTSGASVWLESYLEWESVYSYNYETEHHFTLHKEEIQ